MIPLVSIKNVNNNAKKLESNIKKFRLFWILSHNFWLKRSCWRPAFRDAFEPLRTSWWSAWTSRPKESSLLWKKNIKRMRTLRHRQLRCTCLSLKGWDKKLVFKIENRHTRRSSRAPTAHTSSIISIISKGKRHQEVRKSGSWKMIAKLTENTPLGQ